jgi:predicted transcriptional regulator
MVNISLTSASEALLQQLVEGSGADASVVIEQALRYFCDRQMTDLDTMDGFLSLSEREILEENERRWAAFQDGEAYSQDEVVSHFEGLMGAIEL